MGDRADELKAYGISAQHFIFSTESAREIDKIIALYSGKKVPSMNNFTRIKNK
jgi:hypothetical protein